MKDIISSDPMISFDFKKYRIRIAKKTLHALDDPEYVLLLVNPVDRLIAIQKSDRADRRAHRISWSATLRNGTFEIYSAALMDMLKLCSGWDENQSYRIFGTVNGNRDIVQFRIDSSFKYPGMQEA